MAEPRTKVLKKKGGLAGPLSLTHRVELPSYGQLWMWPEP
jgi:hypothetical protein